MRKNGCQWTNLMTPDIQIRCVHYDTTAECVRNITLTSQWARRRPKSPASRLFTQSFIQPGADQRKHQSSVSLVFVRGIHRWPVNSPHKGPEKSFHLMTSSWVIPAMDTGVTFSYWSDRGIKRTFTALQPERFYNQKLMVRNFAVILLAILIECPHVYLLIAFYIPQE